jgi:hypothetical protein
MDHLQDVLQHPLASAARGRGSLTSQPQCTEITSFLQRHLETAVCNLGSVNLVQHLKDSPDSQRFWITTSEKTIRHGRTHATDNVIDINCYAGQKSAWLNMRHRPVGLGIMGFQVACTNCAYRTHRRRSRTRGDEPCYHGRPRMS